MVQIVKYKLFFRIKERNVSMLLHKDSKILMRNGILGKICCKKVSFLFLVAMVIGIGLDLITVASIIVSSTFDKDIRIKKNPGFLSSLELL